MSQWTKIWLSTWSDFKSVLPYLIGGIALGSVIYGFMPTEFIANVASENTPFAVPIAAIPARKKFRNEDYNMYGN